MKTPATVQRTLQALFISGISTFALVPALAADTLVVTADAAEKPQLVLQITVDQFRGDLPTRYFDRLGKGGLRYLLEEGEAVRRAQPPSARSRHGRGPQAGLEPYP